ncbi:Rho GTPase activation protein [Dichotomocladium elegans]|nr:Rho GTPase activation protein [Dichotomocladium elegans]
MNYPDQRVFGAPLTESIGYARSSVSYIDPATDYRCYVFIPTIVAKCGAFLKERGLMVEGVFRISGSNRRIGILQAIFDDANGFGTNFKWEGEYTVHDAANVMRRFLNHLPEPVITLEYYGAFKDAMGQAFSSVDKKIEAFQELINCLPIPHQHLLLYIMDMLGLFAMTKDRTLMDISALAAVFVPGVLSHPNDDLNPAGYKESQRVLEFLIEHQHRLYLPQTYISPYHSTIFINGDAAQQSTIHLTSSAADLSGIAVGLEKRSFVLPRCSGTVKLGLSATTIKETKTRSHTVDRSVSLPYGLSISTDLKRSRSVPGKVLSLQSWIPDCHGETDPFSAANAVAPAGQHV